MMYAHPLAMSFPSQRISRVSVPDFHPNIHYYRSKYETLVVVENVLTANECEGLSETLVQAAYNTPVSVQRQFKKSTSSTKIISTQISETVLGLAIDSIMSSRHGDAKFCFCEGLLERCNGVDEVRQRIFQANQDIFTQLGVEDRDLFDYFPKQVQPTDCIILAGEGACSTLHRDPFEWTGTSLCLEGTKLWRFIAPPTSMLDEVDDNNNNVGVHCVDRSLKSYRLPSMAWGSTDQDNPIPISSGWQSDFSLYASWEVKQLPSAIHLAQLEEQSRMSEKTNLLERIVNDFDILKPNVPQRLIQSGTMNIPESNLQTTIWTVVQKPGDLLLIPPHWWHQTCALEPSLAVSSQRCGLFRDALRVIHHMFDTRGINVESFMSKYGIGSYSELNRRLGHNPKELFNHIFNFIQ